MDDLALGAANLAAFVAATAGRRGTVAEVRGGTVVASPVDVANGFVNAAVPTTSGGDPADLLDDAAAFFSSQDRSFVVWVPASDDALLAEAARRGGAPDEVRAPAMSIRTPIDRAGDLRFTTVSSASEAAVFGDLCERGYEIPLLGWLLDEHDSYAAPGATWVVASDDEQPLGVACGFRCGPTGGVYYVATPTEHRGRGVAAAVTAHLTDRLLADGAGTVVLQASQLGFEVYRRLGYATYDSYQRFTFTK